MRKLLISILIALLLLITIYSIARGLSIGNIKILGFGNIKSESKKIDEQIAEITSLKEQTYKKAISDIESNAKVLLQEKEKYASLVSTSTDSEVEKATHGHKYEQDFLWAKIGNHATAQGVGLKLDIAIGALNKENYDLTFTVAGTYTNIAEFIIALENDNLLGFKIENFKLAPGGSTGSSVATSSNTTSGTTATQAPATNTAGATNTVANSEASNTSGSSTSGGSSEGTLQATFKVTDIEINIDKTKITSSSSGSIPNSGQAPTTNTNAVVTPGGTAQSTAGNTTQTTNDQATQQTEGTVNQAQ